MAHVRSITAIHLASRKIRVATRTKDTHVWVKLTADMSIEVFCLPSRVEQAERDTSWHEKRWHDRTWHDRTGHDITWLSPFIHSVRKEILEVVLIIPRVCIVRSDMLKRWRTFWFYMYRSRRPRRSSTLLFHQKKRTCGCRRSRSRWWLSRSPLFQSWTRCPRSRDRWFPERVSFVVWCSKCMRWFRAVPERGVTSRWPLWRWECLTSQRALAQDDGYTCLLCLCFVLCDVACAFFFCLWCSVRSAFPLCFVLSVLCLCTFVLFASLSFWCVLFVLCFLLCAPFCVPCFVFVFVFWGLCLCSNVCLCFWFLLLLLLCDVAFAFAFLPVLCA